MLNPWPGYQLQHWSLHTPAPNLPVAYVVHLVACLCHMPLGSVQENLADLNARIASRGSTTQPLAMQRFRPNIVLSGAGSPWCDDAWKRIAVGPQDPAGAGGGSSAGAVLDYVKPCDR